MTSLFKNPLAIRVIMYILYTAVLQPMMNKIPGTAHCNGDNQSTMK